MVALLRGIEPPTTLLERTALPLSYRSKSAYLRRKILFHQGSSQVTSPPGTVLSPGLMASSGNPQGFSLPACLALVSPYMRWDDGLSISAKWSMSSWGTPGPCGWFPPHPLMDSSLRDVSAGQGYLPRSGWFVKLTPSRKRCRCASSPWSSQYEQ
jgi:hypothetical protein